MPQTQDSKEARRRRIVALLQKNAVRSQAELQDLLAARGESVNQATLSRDLRDLGVRKGASGYELPAVAALAPDAHNSLWHAVQSWLADATPAQNLVVLHTPAGGAQPLGLALDNARENAELPGLVGTIAGDDTVLAICADDKKARSLARKLLANRRSPA